MMYRVLERFADLTDKNHLYEAGDAFPRQGLEVSDKRLAELSSAVNKAGRPLITEIKEEVNIVSEPKKRTKKK